jgi:hypothetical protein
VPPILLAGADEAVKGYVRPCHFREAATCAEKSTYIRGLKVSLVVRLSETPPLVSKRFVWRDHALCLQAADKRLILDRGTQDRIFWGLRRPVIGKSRPIYAPCRRLNRWSRNMTKSNARPPDYKLLSLDASGGHCPGPRPPSTKSVRACFPFIGRRVCASSSRAGLIGLCGRAKGTTEKWFVQLQDCPGALSISDSRFWRDGVQE